MMRFLPLLLLSCCAVQDVKPTEAEMDRVEAALKPLPCIGNLADWERRFYYMPEYAAGELDAAIKQDREPKPIGYDKSVVEIDLREAHYEEFGSGRKSYVGFPPGSGDTDDRDYRVAWGEYDLKAGTLHMADCGPNMSPP